MLALHSPCTMLKAAVEDLVIARQLHNLGSEHVLNMVQLADYWLPICGPAGVLRSPHQAHRGGGGRHQRQPAGGCAAAGNGAARGASGRGAGGRE